ncbi:hypothetical protein ACEWY4_027482 [Coilia grayii]|uniref:Succinate dehydrogenase cytochrome b560 subunit, mitochondrial n=1 Tax=Coilia grayii TaxID=363190 RepID=A0ABD1IQM6_9TELE
MSRKCSQKKTDLTLTFPYLENNTVRPSQHGAYKETRRHLVVISDEELPVCSRLTKNMALLLRSIARSGVCASRSQFFLCRHVAPMGTTAKDEMTKFWDKNNRLNRPMSPHITIYRWSIPMAMSVTHRGTGVALSGGISLFAMAALVLPGSYPYYLDLIHSLTYGPHFLAFSKFALAFPVAYHTYNGIRHLMWDVGKGFKIPEVYRSGYAVLTLSVLTSIGLACL